MDKFMKFDSHLDGKFAEVCDHFGKLVFSKVTHNSRNLHLNLKTSGTSRIVGTDFTEAMCECSGLFGIDLMFFLNAVGNSGELSTILGLRDWERWQDKMDILRHKYFNKFQCYAFYKEALISYKLKNYDGEFVDWDVVLAIVSESFGL